MKLCGNLLGDSCAMHVIKILCLLHPSILVDVVGDGDNEDTLSMARFASGRRW